MVQNSRLSTHSQYLRALNGSVGPHYFVWVPWLINNILALRSKKLLFRLKHSLTSRLPADGFMWHFILGIFIKICLEIPSFAKIGHFAWRPFIFYICCRRKIAIKVLSSTETVSGCLDSWGGTNNYANAPCCYVIRTWPTLIYINTTGWVTCR
jgi:hypothetical protein